MVSFFSLIYLKFFFIPGVSINVYKKFLYSLKKNKVSIVVPSILFTILLFFFPKKELINVDFPELGIPKIEIFIFFFFFFFIFFFFKKK
ncbi:MAG: hypothetical protein NHG09_00240 [Candidatus Shikimatogenerans sp. JK-2022]|nr:hypothetical protein [Candidatus Shikimatogenerans bostrichidophilus]